MLNMEYSLNHSHFNSLLDFKSVSSSQVFPPHTPAQCFNNCSQSIKNQTIVFYGKQVHLYMYYLVFK